MTTDTNPIQSTDPKFKNVYFLGAGASVSAGAPTFGNFRDKAIESLGKIVNERDKERFDQVLIDWNKNYKDYNIEEYYTAIEMDELLINNLNIDKKTDDIVFFIALTIEKSLINSDVTSHKILLINIDDSDAIITTNWDIVLETSENDILENGSINYRVLPHHEPLERVRPVTYHIFKLHGSLNWGFCKKCGQIYYFTKKIYNYLTSDDGLKCKKCDFNLKPVIVPPTISKLAKPESNLRFKSPNDQLANIWCDAFKYLSFCEKVFFIGYSFPETDVQMKIFISNALRKNNNLDEICIITDKKYGYSKVEFEERYGSILSKVNNRVKVKFYYNGFEDFINENPDFRKYTV